MSTISIGSASISAPMGMVVGTAKIDSDLQELSLSRRTYYRLPISSSREMASLSSAKQSLATRKLGTSRKTRRQRLRLHIRSSSASK
jgi:hypothetical protein